MNEHAKLINIIFHPPGAQRFFFSQNRLETPHKKIIGITKGYIEIWQIYREWWDDEDNGDIFLYHFQQQRAITT